MAQTGDERQRSERVILDEFGRPVQTTPRVQRGVVVYSAEDLGLKTKKRARRGSSRSARRLEDIERRASRAVRRVARATEHGVSEYIDRRDKSERARRDGALVDFYENIARGLSVGLSEANPVIVDVAQAVNTRTMRRQIRRTLAGLPRIPLFG